MKKSKIVPIVLAATSAMSTTVGVFADEVAIIKVAPQGNDIYLTQNANVTKDEFLRILNEAKESIINQKHIAENEISVILSLKPGAEITGEGQIDLTGFKSVILTNSGSSKIVTSNLEFTMLENSRIPDINLKGGEFLIQRNTDEPIKSLASDLTGYLLDFKKGDVVKIIKTEGGDANLVTDIDDMSHIAENIEAEDVTPISIDKGSEATIDLYRSHIANLEPDTKIEVLNDSGIVTDKARSGKVTVKVTLKDGKYKIVKIPYTVVDKEAKVDEGVGTDTSVSVGSEDKETTSKEDDKTKVTVDASTQTEPSKKEGKPSVKDESTQADIKVEDKKDDSKLSVYRLDRILLKVGDKVSDETYLKEINKVDSKIKIADMKVITPISTSEINSNTAIIKVTKDDKVLLYELPYSVDGENNKDDASKPYNAFDTTKSDKLNVNAKVIQEDVFKIGNEDSVLIDNAIALSKNYKESENAILVAVNKPIDGLVGTSLSSKLHCPILFVDSEKINDNVLAELNRLKVKNIYLLGGEKSLTPALEESLKTNMSFNKVTRIGGKDRYATSIDIAKEVGFDKFAIVSGMKFSDALTAGPLLAKEKRVILLTHAAEQKDKDKALVEFLKNRDVLLIGGEKSVYAIDGFKRIAGENRYETSIEIAKRLGYDVAFTTVDKSVNNTLALSSLAANSNTSLILKDDNTIKKEVKYLESLKKIFDFNY